MSGVRVGFGRMGPFVEGFSGWLLECGYRQRTVEDVLTATGRLGRWMDAEGVDVSELTDDAIVSFVSREGKSGRAGLGRGNLAPLLVYLRNEGVVVPVRGPEGSVEELLAAYRRWLVKERGLAPTTVRYYVKLARRLVESRGEHGDHPIADLGGAEVTAFLLRETSHCRTATAKSVTGQLRSFLRFLYVKGLTPLRLSAAVPPVAGWKDAGIPRGIPAGDVEGILDSCDRNQPGGVRDRAILMLVGRLGLRCIEVARLEVADIDWRAGEIAVRGKARRQDRLPLPHDVGEALVSYMCQVRPARAVRPVFLTLRAPTRPITAGVVSYVCRCACQRAGLPPVGAHRLRHSLATEMLRRGASLIEVGQVLRHQDLVTTAIYAKVDIATLRAVAQPWPGVQR